MTRVSDILSFLREEGVSFSFSGTETAEVEDFSSLAHYKPGSFTWIKKQGSVPEGFDLSRLALVFVSEEVDAGPALNVIRTAESKRAFFSTIEHFYAREEERPAIGQFTYISPKVKLGKNVRIGHNCTLDGDITIGDGTVIWNNVVIINRVTIGKNCDIRSGVVIGHDGYAYTEDENQKKTMVKHFGGVTIGDDVSVYEETHISRGTIDDTVIGNGTKIDAHCHISHNCQIGENTALVVGTALCGSVVIGRGSYVSGATVLNQMKIGSNVNVGLRSVVLKNIATGQKVFGYPARKFSL